MFVKILKNILAKHGPLSVRTVIRIPNTATQRSIKTCAIVDAVWSGIATATDILEKRSQMQSTYWLPLVVFGKVPRTSIATNSRGLSRGNIFSGYVLRGPLLRRNAAQLGQRITMDTQSFLALATATEVLNHLGRTRMFRRSSKMM
jgi:hypothetical protein